LLAEEMKNKQLISTFEAKPKIRVAYKKRVTKFVRIRLQDKTN